MLIAILIIELLVMFMLAFIVALVLYVAIDDNKRILTERKKIYAQNLKASDLIQCNIEELTSAYLYLTETRAKEVIENSK